MLPRRMRSDDVPPMLAACFLLLLAAAGSTAELRINCMPEKPALWCHEANCSLRADAGCVWRGPGESELTPRCVFDDSDAKTMAGYDVVAAARSTTRGGLTAVLRKRRKGTLYGGDYDTVHFAAVQAGSTTLKVTFSWDGSQPKHDDQLHFDPANSGDITVPFGDLTLQVQKSPFGIKVSRSAAHLYAGSSAVLFDTFDIPGLTFSRQYVHVATRFPQSADMYGLGQQFHLELARSFLYTRHKMLAYDSAPVANMNLYGAHPFYIASEPDSAALHGVFLQTDYPMEVFLQPNPQIANYRVAGESGSVSMYFFAGPSYDQVIEQYTDVIGKPYMPPFWSLGFHLSRWGYNSTAGLKKVWDRNRAAHMPQDVQVLDIDYMDGKKDFTVGQPFADLPQFVASAIHGSGRKLVPITDAAIACCDPELADYRPLQLGLDMDIFIKDARTGKPIEGTVWPGSTYFPDFTHPNATAYWQTMMSEFHQKLPYDGAWLDMDEPSNAFSQGSTTGCAANALNNPPYAPVEYAPIYDKTLCMDALHYGNRTHMERHNRYGHDEIHTTHQVFTKLWPNDRPFLYTRSNAPGTGAFGGNWMGDTISNWESLAQSIVGMVEMNMFGIPMTGSDICGFNGNTAEELCMRWHQLGAFYPFCRNHNTLQAIEQDPAVWSDRTVDAIRRSLRLRYSLLPYLYTLLSGAHVKGTPVVRPIFALRTAAAAGDSDTRAQLNIADQFMWGKALMVTPIVKKGTTKRSVFFPPGIWYPLMSGALIDGQPNVTAVVVDASTGGVTKQVELTDIGTIALFLRGGYAIFTQGYGETTAESMRTSFKVHVGLDASGDADGTLYWDDGLSPMAPYNGKYCTADVKATDGTVVTTVPHRGCPSLPRIASILVHGLDPAAPLAHVEAHRLHADDAPVHVARSGYDAANMYHYVKFDDAEMLRGFSVTWKRAPTLVEL